MLEAEGLLAWLRSPAPEESVEGQWVREARQQRLKHIPRHILLWLHGGVRQAPENRPGWIGAQQPSLAVQQGKSRRQPVEHLLEMCLRFHNMVVELSAAQGRAHDWLTP